MMKIKKLKQKIKNLKVGRPPGEITYVGDSSYNTFQIIQRIYDKESFTANEIANIKELTSVSDSKVNWIDYSGYKAVDALRELAEKYGVHQMLIEDIVNTNHLPKYEESEKYIAIILKAYIPNIEGDNSDLTSVCVLLLSNTVIDLHEKPHTYLDAKVDRIKNAKGKARGKQADYLFYVLLDAYIDTYYLFFDEVRDRILELEDELLTGSPENRTEDIHAIKKELSEFRKFLLPLKEAIIQLIKEETELIREENLIYFTDLKDHLNQLVEYYHSYTDTLKSLVDLNNSNINNNINQVMKVLTIIATIFIPLTFIAGIYGMNFEHMPELNYEYGYPIALGIMLIIGLIMLLYMKYKKWF